MNLKKLVIFFILLILKTIYSDDFTKIFLISIPKCGTTMISKLTSLLTLRQEAISRLLNLDIISDKCLYNEPKSITLHLPTIEVLLNCVQNLRKDEYLISHLKYIKEYEKFLLTYNFKIIFIIRDPRDQLVSFVYFYNLVTNNKKQNFDYDLFNDLLKKINKYYSKFLPWSQSSICYTTRFENLVGPNGGGNLMAQINEIKNIAKHLHINLTKKQLKHVCDNLFGNTGTFREGKIGSWKKHFTQEHKDAFKKVAGQLLIDLGYEKDLNW